MVTATEKYAVASIQLRLSPHAVIAQKLAELNALMESHADEFDECGFEALRCVERAVVFWDGTYAMVEGWE